MKMPQKAYKTNSNNDNNNNYYYYYSLEYLSLIGIILR